MVGSDSVSRWVVSAAAANLLQSCPTLCDSISSSPPGSTVPGILQAILEWVAISFSNACMPTKSLQSCPTLIKTAQPLLSKCTTVYLAVMRLLNNEVV